MLKYVWYDAYVENMCIENICIHVEKDDRDLT